MLVERRSFAFSRVKEAMRSENSSRSLHAFLITKDADCVSFLQWALPLLDMRWAGFRKVRAQVCKRIRRRLQALRLQDLGAYREYLAAREDEWKALDGLCRITISSFYRDRGVFESLAKRVLPEIAGLACEGKGRVARVWSAGCASGEEAYSLKLLWELRLKPRFPDLGLRILGTDADPRLLERAQTACYPPGSLKDLPADLKKAGFESRAGRHCLVERCRGGVEFRAQDIRNGVPEGRFHLILCRNLAFTYFGEDLQRRVLGRLWQALTPGGGLVIGAHEALPGDSYGFEPWQDAPHIHRKVSWGT